MEHSNVKNVKNRSEEVMHVISAKNSKKRKPRRKITMDILLYGYRKKPVMPKKITKNPKKSKKKLYLVIQNVILAQIKTGNAMFVNVCYHQGSR